MGAGISNSLSSGDVLIDLTTCTIKPYAADDAISVSDAKSPVLSGTMNKKGQINTNWKSRYFELYQSGKLIYYTDESKSTRKGIANLSTIIGFHVVDHQTFEVITPQRTWCFQCEFTSECYQWIESMKYIENSNVLHDTDILNERDYCQLSSNGSVLKLLAKMKPPEGERILYSDRVVITNNPYINEAQPQLMRIQTIMLMLTTDAIYHLPADEDESGDYTKCEKRIPWHSIENCTILNPGELSIDDIRYSSDPRNMRVIVQILFEVDLKCYVLFQSEEDEAAFRRDSKVDERDELFPSSSKMTVEEMKDIERPDDDLIGLVDDNQSDSKIREVANQ